MTAEEEAAVDRAMAGLDAQADLWAERAGWGPESENLAATVAAIAGPQRMAQAEVRAFAKRHKELVDRWVRQAFAEGFLAGGESRHEYEDASAKPCR